MLAACRIIFGILAGATLTQLSHGQVANYSNSGYQKANDTAPTASAANDDSGPKEVEIQIDQRGILSQHRFRLMWPSSTSRLTSIEVIDSTNEEVVQNIAVPEDINLVFNEVTSQSQHSFGNEFVLKDKILDLEDFNFDNFGDLKILRSWPYSPGSKFYWVMIFHPKTKKFHTNVEISSLQSPISNKKTYRIESIVDMSSWAGHPYTKDYYSIDRQGKLTLQKRYEHIVRDKFRGSFTRTVKLRLNGELQEICKIYFPAEGLPRHISGRKERCNKYTKKYDRL